MIKIEKEGLLIDHRFIGFEEISKIEVKTSKRVLSIRDITIYSLNNENLAEFRLTNEESFYNSLISIAKEKKIIIKAPKSIPDSLIFGGFFSAIFLIAIVVAVASSRTGPSSSVKSSDYNDSCIYLAEKAVKEKLKAPSTATFSNIQVVNAEYGYCLVKGSVDAQNSFGAKINNNFTVEIESDGEAKVTIK